MRNVSHKSCRENQNTHFVFIALFFENLAVYEIMYKSIVEPGRPQRTIWHMSIACWITKATNTPRICNTYCFSAAKILARTSCLVICLCPFPSFVFSLFLHSSFFSQAIQNETKAQMDGRVDFMYRL